MDLLLSVFFRTFTDPWHLGLVWELRRILASSNVHAFAAGFSPSQGNNLIDPKRRRMETPEPEEFAEIDSCGGTYKLIKQRRRRRHEHQFYRNWWRSLANGYRPRWSASRIMTVTWHYQRPRKEPAPLGPALLPTDKLGLHGRQCPDCHSYFRTNGFGFSLMFIPMPLLKAASFIMPAINVTV
jgi:hypothetical protein